MKCLAEKSRKKQLVKTLPVLYDKEKGYRKSDRKRGVWMRRRGKRELAALLAVALLARSAACGADAGEKDAATGGKPGRSCRNG